jgi:hypothetical protein
LSMKDFPKRARHRTNGIPQVHGKAALMAPIEVPIIQSGSTPASCRA